MTPSNRSKTRPKPSGKTPLSWEFEAIGTHWWIGIFEAVGERDLQVLQQQVGDRIEEFDSTYSRFRDDSLVTKIAKKAGEYTFPEDSIALMQFYRQLYDTTDGAVTPLIGTVLEAAGYDATYSFQPKELQRPLEWDEALRFKDCVLTVKRPVTLDFGAAGKGYLVDIVARVLKGRGIGNFCVDAGGDMSVHGAETMRVGLEHPDDPAQIIGVAELHKQAIAGSARNRRAWAEYHHIMDPHTLRSTTGLKADWVVADSCMLADGLATALFFVPPEKLEQFDFEYVLVNDKDYCRRSPDFPAELYEKE